MSIRIKFKKTHPDAVLPTANDHSTGTGDTGYDLTAVEDMTIQGYSSVVVPVGLTLADITTGYWMRIEPRSGLGFKHCIQPHLGVIDNGYRGDLGVKLYNFSNKRFIVRAGERIAQLVVYPLIQPEMSFVDDVTETARGDKGFGSTDKRSDITRPPFAKRTSTLVSETTSDGSETIVNIVDFVSDNAITTPVHGKSNFGEDTNPWMFTDVQVLNDWVATQSHVDEEYYADLLSATLTNRDNLKNV
jgi:dUTP pyrophosphatase